MLWSSCSVMMSNIIASTWQCDAAGSHWDKERLGTFLQEHESSHRQFLEWYTLASNERSIPTLEYEVELLTPLTWF
jgi:hypothetical protein